MESGPRDIPISAAVRFSTTFEHGRHGSLAFRFRQFQAEVCSQFVGYVEPH